MALLGDSKIVSLTLLDGVIGNLNPKTTNVYDLGTTNLKWKNIYGDLKGNADTATKATQDGNGKVISSTYLPLTGGTMTGKITAQASIYTDAANTGALNMNNSNIYGVNAIYTADVSDGAAEGINFYRDATHVDTLWMAGGNIYFVPNRVLGTNTSATDSQKVGRFTATPTTGQVVVTDGTTGGIKTTGFTIAKSVPSDAKFTDTTYTNGSGLSLSGTTFSVATSGVTNAMLAGSISNDKLTNSKITIAGNEVSLGGSISLDDLGISHAMHFKGTTTTALDDDATTNPITINSASYTQQEGDVVLYSDAEYVWTGSKWERLGRDSSFKTTQSTVDSGAAATNKWVSRIQQDANGVVTATMGTLDTSGTWSGTAAKATAANLTTTQNAIAKYSNTTGTFANSGVTIDSSNNIATSGDITTKGTYIFGTNTSNKTNRYISSDAANNIFAKINNIYALVITDAEVRRGASASTMNLGSSSYPWANIYGTNIYGNGSNLTSLNASNLSSGTVAFARLPSMYWANTTVASAASYNTTPEVASVKIGNGTATAAGAKGATLQYDATLEVLNFVFA